jgi:hypothetical protein
MDFRQLEIQVGPGTGLCNGLRLLTSITELSFLQAVKDNEVVLFMKGTPEEPMVIAYISVSFSVFSLWIANCITGL